MNILKVTSVHSSGLFPQKFEMLGWKFLFVEKNFYVGKISRNNIRQHKLRLKSIIKDYSSSDTFLLLNLINRILFEWSFFYSCSDFSWDIWSELDVYLDKLLWKWARRRHPRRPNTWIYLKYWKPFFGSWKFFALDVSTSRVIFLRSHCLSYNLVYRLPLSIHVYDLLNLKKIQMVFFKKFLNLFQGIFRVLWKRQKGLCFSCKKSFVFINFNNVKVCKISFNNNYLYSLALLHVSC
jgi:RNA-directed DNA polymerase